MYIHMYVYIYIYIYIYIYMITQIDATLARRRLKGNLFLPHITPPSEQTRGHTKDKREDDSNAVLA